jgi:hypothetical protein
MKPCAHKSVQRSALSFTPEQQRKYADLTARLDQERREMNSRSPPVMHMTRLVRPALESGFVAAALMTTVSVMTARSLS